MEYIGYAASLIILISLLMSSVRKLRWINLLGSAIFCVYGFLIGSLPVALMNIGTIIINIYYLYHMYLKKDYFRIIPISGQSGYLDYFLEFYEKDIKQYLPSLQVNLEQAELSFYILRNVVPAGVFICSKYDDYTLKIDLDYVVPNYRDFKIGQYVFSHQKDVFLEKGYHHLVSLTNTEKHIKYLEKMGFVKNETLSHETMQYYEIHLLEATDNGINS